MQIHVARNGQQLGQYSIEEVNRKLADGTFSATDLAWYDGAAGWAPLSSVPGVTIPGESASPPLPSPLAAPSPAPPAPIAPNAPFAQPQPYNAPASSAPRGYNGMVITSWALLGVTFIISLIPVLGCGSWFLVWPVALATFIMAIVILNRGGKTQGILLLIASILIIPLALVAPVITTAALGGAVSREEQTQVEQIMENLRAIEEAKTRWVTQTKVTEGAYSTVAGLTPYLEGKEIKSVVGETYDPRPVGQKSRATLPATKSLAGHGKGATLTSDGESYSPTPTVE